MMNQQMRKSLGMELGSHFLPGLRVELLAQGGCSFAEVSNLSRAGVPVPATEAAIFSASMRALSVPRCLMWRRKFSR